MNTSLDDEKTADKPGTVLASLIPDWAVTLSTCECKNWTMKMDRWGCAGCRIKRLDIINHLAQQDDKLIPVLRVLPVALKRWGAGQLVDQSIRIAERARNRTAGENESSPADRRH